MEDKEIIIEDDYCSWNGMRTIYFQCQQTSHSSAPYGTHGLGEACRCGGDSMYIVSYKTISGKEISKHLCEQHTNKIIKDAQDKNYKITDYRKPLTK